MPNKNNGIERQHLVQDIFILMPKKKKRFIMNKIIGKIQPAPIVVKCQYVRWA